MTKPINPFDLPKPTAAPIPNWDLEGTAAKPIPGWNAVIQVPTAQTVPPGTALDRSNGAVIYEDDNKTPYDQNNMLMDWKKVRKQLAEAKKREADLRGKVVACFSDPSKVTGTENIELGQGWFVKIEKKQTYTLKSFEENVTATDAVVAMLNALCAALQDSQGQPLDPAVGLEHAKKLVKWKADLSTSAYDALEPGYKEIVDRVLEIKPATPTVTLVSPKGAEE